MSRLAGLSIPLFSLRAEEDSGIGEIGDLPTFLEWAAGAGQRMVALLPIGEGSPGEASPYNTLSTFAVDPLYLTVAKLPGLGSAPRPPAGGKPRVEREQARAWKQPLFAAAFAGFRALPAASPERERFNAFRSRAAEWLSDYSLFRVLAEEQDWRSWRHWPEALRRRDPRALAEARTRFGERLLFHEYLQFAADEQWREAREAARRLDILLMGDLPFAPSENSAEVWSHPALFDLSRSVGAPPDAFSENGQRWGLPMYRWSAHRASGWQWFRSRARRMGELYDLFRVDHVVGLFRTFFFVGAELGSFDPEEPAAQEAQGREILELLGDAARPAWPIAEDLGVIPAYVPKTLAALDIPGFKVMRWEKTDHRFDDPLDYPECSIAATGTHDTDTLAAWWTQIRGKTRRGILDLLGLPGGEPLAELTTTLLRSILERLYRSRSRYVLLPIQDLFGWKERINLPGKVDPANWTYRLPMTTAALGSDPGVRGRVDAIRRLIDASGRTRTMGISRGAGMEEFQSGSVRAGDLNFHYLEAGSGPLVLCLHGFPDHARSFRHQLPALAKAGYRAVAPFLRGYAPSDVPANGPYQSAALSKDVVALLDALSPREPAYVFGHDWGAVAAYGAAILAPARIQKLITAAVPHGPQLMEGLITRYAQIRRSFYIFFFQLPTAEMSVAHDDFAFLQHLWCDWSPGWSFPAEEMASLKATFRKPGVLEAALGYYRHTFNPAFQVPELADLQSRMLSDPIQVPGMMIHGAKDGCIGVELLDGMEASFPKGLRKVIVADAGHFVHQEKPELVNAELLQFLGHAP